MISDIAHWPVGPVQLIWREGDLASLPITGAHGFCFDGGTIVLCDIEGRGLTIPGGHIHDEESIEDCLRREVSEEAYVDLGRLALLGYIEADHRANPNYDGPYPIRSVQAVFHAKVTSINDFESQHEASHRLFVPIADVPTQHHEWNAVLQAAFNAAIDSSFQRFVE